MDQRFKIKNSGFKPDLVIGIARGGLVPARIVCNYLLHIKVEHWGIAAIALGNLEVKSSVLHYKTCSTFVPDYWAGKIQYRKST